MTGFKQDLGCRVFAYEGIGEDRVRMRFTVRADLDMSRKYGIRLQELPLMCLEILERSVVCDEAGVIPPATERALIYTEAAMMQYSDECEAARVAAALKRTSIRRSPPKAPVEPGMESHPHDAATPPPVNALGQNWQMK